jgi:hypothetical protein
MRARRYAEVEETMFRAALEHPDPVMRVRKSERRTYRGTYSRAVADLERLNAALPALLAAAHEPLAEGNTERLRRGVDALAEFTRGESTSVLWDAASSIERTRRKPPRRRPTS